MVASRTHRRTMLPPPADRRMRATEPPLPGAVTDELTHAEQLVETAARILSRADEIYHSAAAMGAPGVCLSHYRVVRGSIR